jgi:hypothetical protein
MPLKKQVVHLFLPRHKKSACILLNKSGVERASKVREDKTLTIEAMNVSIEE